MFEAQKPMQILLVEDVDFMRDHLANLLAEGLDGGRVDAVRSTWEARLAISRRRPDLVLLDEVLPGESSVDFLRELGAQKLPVILLTGLSETNDLQRAVSKDALGRIHKPRFEGGRAEERRFQQSVFELIRSIFPS